MKTIVMFGDSITHTGSSQVPPKRHWPVLVQDWLRRDGYDVRVINSGIGGHTTAQGLDRIDRDVLCHYPFLTFVEFGFNDNHEREGPGIKRVPFEDFVANLRKIVNLIRHVTHGKVVLIANHPTSVDTESPGGSGKYREKPQHYNRGVRQVAKELDVPVLNMHGLFVDPRHPLAELVTEDGLHLSAKGSERYGEVVCDYIVKSGLLD